MSADAIFSASNLLAMVGWLLLIFAGRVKSVPTLITGAVIPLLLGLVYAALIVTRFGGAEGGFGSIREVRALFANDWLLVAGWVHYLAFDLFIGSWQARDAVRHGIPHWLIAPALILTFLFGPVGLVLYMALRLYRVRKLAIES